MNEKLSITIVWGYIILALIAFVRIIIVGDSVIDSIIGTVGIVMMNLLAWVVLLGDEDE